MEERGIASSEPQYPMNPETWNPLRKQIEKVVKSSTLPEDEKCFFISKRLNNANQPTNTDTLTACFNQLGIHLTDEEKDIAKYRNRFLHGQLPVRNVIGEMDSLYLICVKMHHLCSLLLLKLAGFSGYVVNQSQFISKPLSLDDLPSIFRDV